MSTNIMDMIKVGVLEGEKTEGTVWDEKGRCQIAKIFLSHGPSDFIRSLQFLFVENGQFVLSDNHGVDHNCNFITVVLDYPSEFLTGIRGTYYSNGLRSITFDTNKGSYGPYGGIDSQRLIYDNFNIPISNDCSFGGFYGTKTDAVIENIGLYVNPVASSMTKPTTNSLARRSKRKEAQLTQGEVPHFAAD